MNAAETSAVVRFGVFELDVASGVLRKAGVRLNLQMQPLQVLTALLERRGEVVTREELQQRLWADDTFVDFERSLNAAVKRLRDTTPHSAARAVRGLSYSYRFDRGIARPRRRSSATIVRGIS